MSGLVKRLNDVLNMIGRMCSEGRPPKMSIPANPAYDEDFLISDTVREAADAVERLTAELDKAKTAINDTASSLTEMRVRACKAEIERDALREDVATARREGYLKGIEDAEKVCCEEICICCWNEDAQEAARHLANAILALKEGGK